MENTSDIKIYEGDRGNVRVEVRLEKETIWLTQEQIADLFAVDRTVILKHIGNIYKYEELQEKGTCAIFAHVGRVGHSKKREYDTKIYNLDVILSVGYRVNSKKATTFRIWANKILKNYLVKGYAINEKKFIEAQGIIQFITSKAKKSEIEGHEKEILDVIERYSKTWKVLGDFDEGKIENEKYKKTKFQLNYEKCHEIIENLKYDLVNKKLVGDLFGQEREHIFEGILGNLEQSFGGEDLYGSIEEKAAHLLYFVIKDHPFSDGNKRVGSLLFLYFLNKNNFLLKENSEAKISDRTLVALALLVASSDPKEKELIVKLIINLIQE